MIHLALQSEYTFQKCYGHLEQIVNLAKERDEWALGLADKNNTFGHVKFNKLCKSAGIKPIFGVRLDATDETIKSRSKYETFNQIIEVVLIAKNTNGLVEIYKLVNKAYDQYYYFPRINFRQVSTLSKNILVIAPYFPDKAPNLASRIDFKALNPATLYLPIGSEEKALRKPLILCIKNEYINIEDKGIYQTFSSPRNTEAHTYPQHILSENELLAEGISKNIIDKTDEIAQICNAKLNKSKMLKYTGKEKLFNLCIKGAFNRKINLDNEEYNKRLTRELKLIEDKDFTDYFLIVADMIKEAKKTMLVGPARGSSAGSLVCYLIGITEIDPIKYGLLFERFIDINRLDFPDIDTDFPDIKREQVIKYLSKKYGINNVKCIGTVSTLKSKSAIGEFSKALDIPAYETDDVKSAIIERSGGDVRAEMCIEDTLNGTDIGKKFIEKYPEMKIVSKIEGHARHAGKHAAGIIVSNEPLYNYGGIDSRENIIMMDKKDAESLNLLKIDALGLRTLSILEETAKLANFDYKKFYKLSLDDKKVFSIFNDNRMYGVFQFEGQALQIIVKQMGVHSFNDIAAITALARPGALNSGGTAKYIKYHTGQDIPKYFDEDHKKITEETYSTVVYQEQMMMVAKIIGDLSWEDVSDLRKAASKSLGDEYFSKYREKFIYGAKENKGYDQEKAEIIWKDISSSGLWSFNKSHAISYGLISYWTAWCKVYHPLEFAAANLNHARNDESAVRILRDFVINDQIEYIPIDPDNSNIKWSIKNGKLIGGLTNIDGIGIKKAQEIIRKRENHEKFTPALFKKLLNPKTAFDILFPTEYYWGQLYTNPEKFNLRNSPFKISDVNEPGEYTIIGCVLERDLRDRNDYQSVVKRGYEVTENQFYLNLYIQDDTDSIKCMIPPFDFDKLNGKELAEKSIPGKTWYWIKGTIRDQWRSISIKQIVNLENALGPIIPK